MTEIGIIGAGDQALETVSYIEANQDSVLFYAIGKDFIKGRPGFIELESPSEAFAAAPVVTAVGSPLLRKKLAEQWPGTNFTNVIAQPTYIDKSATLGMDVTVGPFAFVGPRAAIGDHCTINAGSLVHHGCQLADYVTISPGVKMGGNVVIGEGAFIGIGATIKNDVKIAGGVAVGAGAVVINDLDTPNATYVGNPAKLIKQRDGWLDAIK